MVDGLCGVVSNDDLRHASMMDLSMTGVRLERPFDPKAAKPVVQLEIDLPGLDEVVWARGVVTFAVLTPMGGRTLDGQPRFWCRAGLRLEDVCRRERRMLLDYVVENLRSRRPVPLEPVAPRTLSRGELAASLAGRPRVAA